MSLKNTHLFDSDPDWSRYASKQGYTLRQPPYAPVTIDIPTNRAAQIISEGEWAASHLLHSIDYSSHTRQIQVRDGTTIEIKVSCSTRVPSHQPLPLLFVTHGGGWVQGTHTTEEAWLLWPLLQAFDLVVISVSYRLAPEFPSPTYINDSWDAFRAILLLANDLHFDPTHIILAGSSAGALISSTLSHLARSHAIPIRGVLLNVPVLCDYRHFPHSQYEYTSYNQCMGTLLGGLEMKYIWDLVVPSPNAGSDPLLSPLLGELSNLPPHAIFVAGQDPLRDEGVAYADKLRESGVKTSPYVYPGVPHTFAEVWELEATQRFWGDVKASLGEMLEVAPK